MTSSHERFQGPVHIVSGVREGWVFDCECGFRSPLFTEQSEALDAMRDHRAAPPPDSKKPRRLFHRAKWPGWPHDRRHRPFV